MNTLKRFCMLIVALMVISTFSCAYATSFISLDNNKIVDISSTDKITDNTLLTKTKTSYVPFEGNNNGLKPETAKHNIQNSINTQKYSNFNIITSLEGVPKTAHKGQEVIFKYVISNTGKKTIYNVKIVGQELEKELGTLKPGETKKIICTDYIYTDAELEEIFGSGTTESNLFYVGTGTLYFKDVKGCTYTQELNPVEIKLV